MQDSDSWFDGNAAGGVLSAIFAIDITTAIATCAGCRRTMPVAQLRVYALEMGAILRCPGCGDAMIRVGRNPDGYRVDLRGTGVLHVRSDA